MTFEQLVQAIKDAFISLSISCYKLYVLVKDKIVFLIDTFKTIFKRKGKLS